MSSQHPPLADGRGRAASDAALKAALHRVFDRQIPNYASYNLVCAAEAGGMLDGPFSGTPTPRGVVLGYRRQPIELVIAPFDRRTLEAAGRPWTVDLTNLAYAAEPSPGAFDVGTSTGREFSFTIRSLCQLDPAERSTAPRTLEQEDDADDFTAFMRDLCAL
ncbi:hypothetical protein [Sinomonas susongensis]|uniref:hypothetical protein n=1 Tax=Sinomonas susongensis TaxID=1324851 RepID=UPI00110980D0|nr:hypothetical protein [Sinomonas susongensis]